MRGAWNRKRPSKAVSNGKCWEKELGPDVQAGVELRIFLAAEKGHDTKLPSSGGRRFCFCWTSVRWTSWTTRGNIFPKEASESTHTHQCFPLGCQSIKIIHQAHFCVCVFVLINHDWVMGSHFDEAGSLQEQICFYFWAKLILNSTFRVVFFFFLRGK